MYKENPTEDEIIKELNHLYKVINEKHEAVTNFHSEYKFVENESWCLDWFNHYTYNLFETDEEVEKSFRDFVSRKEY